LYENSYNIGNWTDAHIPVSGDDAVIPDVSSASNRFPYIDVAAVCANIDIRAGAYIRIAPDFSLTVENTLTNSAGNSGIQILSNATGTGSLIHNTADVDATVQLYLSGAAPGQWHYISPSVASMPKNLFSPVNFYQYNENTADYWWGHDYRGVSGWETPPAILSPGTGYINYGTATTVTGTGKLNYNPAGYTLTADYTEHPGNDPAFSRAYTNYDGWNLFGNPYASALDFDAFTGLTNIDNTVYFYDDNTDNYKYFNNGGGVIDNNIQVNGATQYIPVGQAFFVKCNNTAGGSLTMPPAARVHNTQNFWKSENDEPQNVLRLKTQYGTFTDELVIRTLPDASEDFDSKYDAYKRFSWNTQMPQLYAFTESKANETAIHTIPEFSETVSVPLGFYAGLAVEYSISLSNNTFPQDVNVYIEDKLLNTNKLLTIGKDYSFESGTGIYAERFVLHLVKTIGDKTDIEPNPALALFPNPTNNLLTITAPSAIHSVMFWDVTGRMIYEERNNFSEIDVRQFSSGIYSVRVNYGQGQVHTAKFVKL